MGDMEDFYRKVWYVFNILMIIVFMLFMMGMFAIISYC